jgi:uncharacterized membrane protein YoaK (UPF0700 family)
MSLRVTGISSSNLADSRSATLMAGVLSLTAGSADVISFLGLGGLFNSHITGNLVILAVRVVNGGTAPIALLLSVPLFLVVVFLIRLVASRLQFAGIPPLLPLLLLQLLLLVACLVVCVIGTPVVESTPTQVVAGMLAVSAMAVQNALVQTTLTNAPPTAAMTANVTRFGLAMAELVLRRTPQQLEAARSQVEHTWPALVGFAAGAGVGAIVEAHVGLWAFMLPVLTALLALGLGVVATGALELRSDARSFARSRAVSPEAGS